MDRAALRKLDSSGKVAIATIADSILPALNVADEKADWGYLLVMKDNHRTYRATQIPSTLLTPLTILLCSTVKIYYGSTATRHIVQQH